MIPVCKDMEANGEKSMWFYAEEKYSRYDSKRNLKGQITGKNLPNPQELWKARCETHGGAYPAETVQSQSGETIRLKPTEAAFKLFEHWQNISSGE